MLQERDTGITRKIAYLLSVVLLFMVYFLTQYEPGYLTSEIKTIALIAALLIQLGIAAAMEAAIRKQWKAEYIFLMVYIPVSLGMLFAMPLGSAPDEISHIGRSWQVLIGQWFQSQGEFFIPANFMEWYGGDYHKVRLYYLFREASVQVDWSNLVRSGIGAATGVYPVNNNFPQAAGMWMMNVLSDNRLLIMYGSRFGAWAVTAALYYYAVKKIPYGKYTLIAISMFPMFLQEAASASADGLTCGATAAFLAYFLDLRMNPSFLRKRDITVLFLLVFHVCTYKVFYFPLAFLLLAIPEECYGSRRRKSWNTGWILLISFAAVIGWLLICKTSFADPAEKSDWGTGNILPQIDLVIQHPLRFLGIVCRTMLKEFFPYASGMLGRGLSWQDIRLPNYLSAVQIVGILGAFVCDGSMTGEKPGKLRVQITTVSAITVLVMFTALYIWWSPYGADTVSGIQGRYFLPLLPGMVLAIKGGWKRLTSEEWSRMWVFMLAMINIASLLSIFIQGFG